MIEHLLIYIQTVISEYGAWGVFIATLIEEVVVLIPSPLVSLASGFFLLSTELSFVESMARGALVVALPVTMGISMGSAFVYALGFFGGKPSIEKTKKWTRINWQDIEKIETRLTQGVGDEVILFILRVIPVVPGVAISAFSGIVRYPFVKFIVITCLGAFVRALILAMIGWQVGELYVNYASVIAQFEKYIFFGIFVALCIIGVRYWYIRGVKRVSVSDSQ